YKRLANCGQFLSVSQNVLQILNDNDEQNIVSLLNYARSELTELASMDHKLSNLLNMLEEAAIQINEVSDELRHYSDQLELDPNRLFEL
ncbi:DNA repair protein RecN, partial [Xenorhabdus bovienii]|nr:DNA repair protein RecN [Xenorhabdus bovienii]